VYSRGQVDKDLVLAEAPLDLHNLACRGQDREYLSHIVISELLQQDYGNGGILTIATAMK
jgi:hypothetical protein